MALQPKEKKLLKILAGVIVVGGFIMFRSSKPQDIPVTESDPAKAAELEAKQKAKASTKSSSKSSGSAAQARSTGGGGGSRSSAPTIATISISEFESHNTVENCWVLIDGKVYDITDYVKNSPEPNAVAPYCGTFGFEEGYVEEISSTKQSIINEASLKGTIG